MELQIPNPPKELFVREHREETTGEVIPLYPLEKIDCISGKGILVYRTEALYPEKGWPQPAQIYALNQIKRMLVEFAGLCSSPFIALGIALTDKNVLMNRFNSLFDKLYETYSIKEEFMCDASRYFNKFLSAFLIDCGFDPEISRNFAFRCAQIVEGDNRYRYRLQDIAGEYKEGAGREVQRLMMLYSEREDGHLVTAKIRKMVNMVKVLLIIPRYKKAFLKNAYLIKFMAMDDGDWYWANQGGNGKEKPLGNYNYKGLSWEERKVHQVPATYSKI